MSFLSHLLLIFFLLSFARSRSVICFLVTCRLQIPLFIYRLVCSAGRKPSNSKETNGLAALTEIVNANHTHDCRQTCLHNVLQHVDDGSEEIGINEWPDRRQKTIHLRNIFWQSIACIVGLGLFKSCSIPYLIFPDAFDFLA